MNGLLLPFLVAATGLAKHGVVGTEDLTCRNRFLWPFASTSIWNTPIGSAAVFHDINLYNDTSDRSPPTEFHNDQDWIVFTVR